MELCMEYPLLEIPMRRECLILSYLRISQKWMQRMVEPIATRGGAGEGGGFCGW